MSERWAPAPGFPAYEVSEDGRVRRVLCKCGARLAEPNYLRGRPDRDGYRRITLYRGRSRKEWRLARLVLEAFAGPAPGAEYEAAHKDGDNQNDRFSNLRWATPKENAEDKIAHGTHLSGSRAPSAILTESTVRRIRALRKSGHTYRTISELTGATHRNIQNIISGVSWRSVA